MESEIVEKNKELLESVGFSREELEKRTKQPGWQVFFRMRPSELENMIKSLRKAMPEEGIRRLFGRLAHPKFQEEYKRRKRRAVPAPNELYYAVLSARELAKRWHLPEEKAIDFVVRYADSFLFLKPFDATLEIAKKMLGKKFDFLMQYGFRENEILILLRSKRGSKWLEEMDLRRLQYLKNTLSTYKLGSLFPRLLRADLHKGFTPKTSAELRDKINKILATGKQYGLSEEKIKAMLRRNPHILTSRWFNLARYLELSLKLKPSMKSKPKPLQKRQRPR